MKTLWDASPIPKNLRFGSIPLLEGYLRKLFAHFSIRRNLRASTPCDQRSQEDISILQSWIQALCAIMSQNREKWTTNKLLAFEIDTDRMRDIWIKNLAIIQATPFTDQPSKINRYCYTGGPFPWGDAIALRMIIHHYRPKRIIEVGSGYTSACMLNSAEHACLSEFHLTCVDPNTERLRSCSQRRSKRE